MGAVLAFDVYDDHQKTTSREQQRLMSLAEALNKNIGEQLRASLRMLEALRQETPALLVERGGLERLNRRMALLTESVVGVRSLVLVSADGVVLSSNRPELLGRNFKGSERYQSIKAGNDPAMLYISPPYKTPLGIFTISLGKTIVDAEGRFNGYVLAILDPEYFGVLMQSLLYAPDMRISVAHGDGKVIFSTQTAPDLRGIDLSLNKDSPFSQHQRSGRDSSFIIDRATATEDIRFIAIRSVFPTSGAASKPLVVAVSRDSAAIVAEWEKSAQHQGILFAGIVLAVCLGHFRYTRRKQAYQLLDMEKTRVEKESEERIRETDAQFRGYFENMAVGAVQLDASGRFQLVNDRYCEMTGYDREDLLGKMRLSDLSHPDDHADELEQMRTFLAGKGENLDLEKRVVRKNGEVIWVHMTAHAVRAPAGKLKFTTAVIEDVTPRKRLMIDLESAKIAAEAANRAKTLFLGNMSHEMRTPLHQISGIAGMFRRDSPTEKQAQRLGLLESAVKHLDTVIGRILTLVDIEAGSTEIKLSPVDMSQIVGSVVSMAAERIAEKNLSVLQEVSLPPYAFKGDAKHLTTILNCYCNNAITFSEHGKIAIRVSQVSEDAGSVMVRIAVEDQGVGIAAEDLNRLFEYFEQIDNSHTRKYGGTGIGLAIAKKLAKLMGGDAGCSSVPGRGSTFWATVRLVKADAQEASNTTYAEDFQI